MPQSKTCFKLANQWTALSALKVAVTWPCWQYIINYTVWYALASGPCWIVEVVNKFQQQNLRFYLYAEHYYPNLTTQQRKATQTHLDHCIESLRKATMCHADTNLVTFNWKNPTTVLPELQTNGRMTCTKWSSIETWATQRMVYPAKGVMRLADIKEEE